MRGVSQGERLGVPLLRSLAAIWQESPFLMPLVPLLALEAVYARLFALKLPEPEGERSGRCGAGPSLSLLIVGDSAAAGVGVDHQSQALCGNIVQRLSEHHVVRWNLMARTGATTETAIQKLQAAPTDTFDVALTCLGVNDVTSGMSVRDWLLLQSRLFELLRTRFAVRRIYVTALPPMHKFTALPQPLRWFLGRRAQRFNAAIANLVQGSSPCSLIRLNEVSRPEMLSRDGYHPSAEAYRAWGEAAAGRIREYSRDSPAN